jgi:hypothetical protein
MFQFRIYYMPILMYGAKTWAQIRSDIDRPKGAETIWLRTTA